jgi:serine/threonine-protein kinase
MGRVFLAEHRLLQSHHAIKLLHPELSSHEELVQRFINEGRAASALQHPNIVPVRDVGQGENGGPWYLVMDYLHGQTLRQIITAHGGPLPPHRIARLIDDVLNALHAAHGRFIVHRDMKPDNIMVSPVDDPALVEKATVLDFGVARLGQGAELVTRKGVIVGTPQYMAPEQVRGAALDHRADLWAVGAIVYEMATGGWLPYHDRPLPEGYLTGAEIFYRMMTQQPVDPRQRCAQISEELAAVIRKALAVDPANRYASARAFALALAAAVPADGERPSGMQLLERRAKALCGIEDLTETLRSPRPAALPTPSIASRYELGPLLGAGGMAEVFMAHALGAEGFSRPVALKRVGPGLSEQPAFASMFIDEARISARLAHPNVVQVFDFNRDETGRLFLVMEYIAGKDLASIAETGVLPMSVTIFIIIEVLRGLGYAHALPNADGTRGVVHRDVSPQNVMISWEGSVKVGDFGIARARDASGNVRSSVLKGKPAYMAPEQIEGLTDARSDLFAVGVILHELLTGRRLFSGLAKEVFGAILFREVVPPSRVRRGIPRDIEAIALKLLARERADRYASAELAIEALSRCAAHPRDGRSELVRLLAERFPAEASSHSRGQHSAKPGESVAAHAQLTSVEPPGVVARAAVPEPMHTTLGTAASQVIGKAGALHHRAWIVRGAAVAAVAAVAVLLVALWSGRRERAAAAPVASGSVAPAIDAPAIDAPAIDAGVESVIPVRDAAAVIAVPADAAAAITPGGLADAGVPAAPSVPTTAGTQPAKRVELGSLAVYATPWCLVWIDGKSHGETPVHARLPVGVHRVRLKNDTQERMVTVTITTSKETVIDETW